MDRSIRRYLLLAAGIFLFLAAAGPFAGAGEIGENLYLNGFVSQGYLNTSSNDFLVPRSMKGTSAFTEAAITLIARPMDRLQVGIQFLGRNFGDTGNDQVLIDWAYGDFRWKDQLGFRAGKVKLPFGLYNEGRDVDMLRTSIFLPQSIYNEKQRDFTLAYEGAGLYGNFDIHGGGEIEYHVYGGTLTVPDAARGFWRDLYEEGGRDATPLAGLLVDMEYENPLGTAQATFGSLEDPQVNFPWIIGGAVIWNTPLEGFRIGSTAMQGRYNIQTTLRYDVEIPEGFNGAGYHPFVMEVDEKESIDHLATLSAEYVHGDLTLAAEYYQDKISDSKTVGWYVQSDYRFSRLYSLCVYYADYSPFESHEDQMTLELLELPDYYAWQRALTVSSRFDLTDFWLFKLEYHFTDGVAGAERRSLVEDQTNPKKQHWGIFVAKTTFHF